MQTIRKDDVLFLKGIIHRKHGRMPFPRVDGFVDQNKVNPLINKLDLNRPNTITTLSKAHKYLTLYYKLKFLVYSSG